jgi:transglutaminase-like putative cysteine protease
MKIINFNLFVFIFVLILFSNLVFSSDLYYKQSLDLNLKISNEVTLIPSESNYKVSNINIFLQYMPFEYHRQKTNNILFFPKAEIINNSIYYNWENPIEKILPFGFVANLTTNDNFLEINKKVNFPIINLDEDVKEYLSETDYIDYSNNAIKKLAYDLASGEDDLMKVVYKFSKWVHQNINYELNSKTIEQVNKASWVLENKIGVCDEFSTLLVALCRSVGIPAKLISGISYTEDPRFDEKWNFHSWVEIYFPGYGWVSFDPTFGELGYVNTAHIKLKEYIEPGQSSSTYEWVSENIDLKPSKLIPEVKVNGFGDVINSIIELNSKVLKEKIDFNSHNLLILEFVNNNDFYVIEKFYRFKIDGFKYIDDSDFNFVFLEPNSKKTLFFPLKISEELDSKYIYTFDLVTQTRRNVFSNTHFSVEVDQFFFTLLELEEYIKNNQEEISKPLSKDIYLNCSTNKENYLVKETVFIDCVLKNIGNVLLDKISLCFEDNCFLEKLDLLETKSFSFNYELKDKQKNKFLIKAFNDDFFKSSEIYVNIFERPILNMEYIDYPKNIEYGQEFSIDFKVSKMNTAEIIFFNATIISKGINQEWIFNDMDENRKFSLLINSKQLSSKTNSFDIIITYKDSFNKKYLLEDNIEINFVNLSFKEKSLLFLNKIIDSFFNNVVLYIVFLTIFSIVFTLVFGFITGFRKKK